MGVTKLKVHIIYQFSLGPEFLLILLLKFIDGFDLLEGLIVPLLYLFKYFFDCGVGPRRELGFHLQSLRFEHLFILMGALVGT